MKQNQSGKLLVKQFKEDLSLLEDSDQQSVLQEIAEFYRLNLESMHGQNRDEALFLSTKAEVFGTETPSIAGLRSYIKSLKALGNTDLDEKKAICKKVNFWKNRLQAEFVFKGEVCNLTAKPNGGSGRFWLRKKGTAQENLGNYGDFPDLRIRKKKER